MSLVVAARSISFLCSALDASPLGGECFSSLLFFTAWRRVLFFTACGECFSSSLGGEWFSDAVLHVFLVTNHCSVAMPMQFSGIVRVTEYEVDWEQLKELLDSGVDLKQAMFQPDADVMSLGELLGNVGDIKFLYEDDQDTYMKLAATIDPVSWYNMVAEPFDGGIDYTVNARLARETIKVGREAEILALTCDDATCNILDAALFQCGQELCSAFQCGQEWCSAYSPTFYHSDTREYICEPPKLLCLELVKLGMQPMLMESILDRQNRLYDSFVRAAYVQAAFEAGLIQELRKFRRDEQELFLTDLPMHIVLAIRHDAAVDLASASVGRSVAGELKFLGGMVDGMMTHGLSTRFTMKNILAFIEGNYEVETKRDNLVLHRRRVRESRTSFLKKWRRREMSFSKQRLDLIQKFLAQVDRPVMPSSVLHMIDSFLLGEFLAVLDDEVGVAFKL